MSRVTVKLFGAARLASGVKSFALEVATADELLDHLPGMGRKEAKDLVMLVNGQPVKKRYRFKEGDEVVFLSPVGGG